MKFYDHKKVSCLKPDKNYTGYISKIEETEGKNKRSYLSVTVVTDRKQRITIWCDNEIDPNHPLYELFSHYVDEETAEDFDLNELTDIQIRFTVKNFKNGKDGTERSYFKTVTPIYEEEEADEEQ